MSLVLLVVFLGPLLMLLGKLVGASFAFLLVLSFHGLRGLIRWFLLPWFRAVFKKKVVHEPAV